LGFTDFIVAIEKIVKGLNERCWWCPFLHQAFAGSFVIIKEQAAKTPLGLKIRL
jgi:hypothetical protein